MPLSFKDVGVRTDSIRQNVLTRNKSLKPIGIKTPLEIDNSGRDIFITHFNLREQIEDNLRNLLLTNHGERVFLYDFGANLHPLAAEYSSKDDFDTEAMIRINTAISKWMPFVTPLEFSSIPDRENNRYIGKIKIFVTYAVPGIGVRNGQIELELSVM